MIVGPISPKPSEFAIGGASTRAISSQKSACCINVALRPPYSLGQETAAHRPSCSFRCHARRYGNDSSIGFSRHSLQSFGTFVASHARSSSRNADSSTVKFKSIQETPSRCQGQNISAQPRSAPRSTHLTQARLFGTTKSGRIVSRPCQYFLRSSFFRIFPVAVLGRLATNSKDRGHL